MHPALKAALQLGEREIPGFKIRHKPSSRRMRLMHRFARLFSPAWLTRFHTTLGNTIYTTVTRHEVIARQQDYVPLILHELTHMVDRRDAGFFRFTMAYAFPQILALLALPVLLLPALLVLIAPSRRTAWVGLAIGLVASVVLWAYFCPWVLLCLVFLAALAPWPSAGRTKWERRGYKMTAAAEWWLYGDILRPSSQAVAHFVGWDYYRMSWDENRMQLVLLADHTAIRRDEISDPWFKKVRDALP